MLDFEETPTGYRATDQQVAWWQARDSCPAYAAIVSPVRVDGDGRKHYSHDCDGPDALVEWSCYSAADTVGR